MQLYYCLEGKVLLICDQKYQQQADRCAGGVGTEAQIISGAIYQSSTQTKFVAVVRKRDEKGRACLLHLANLHRLAENAI